MAKKDTLNLIVNSVVDGAKRAAGATNTSTTTTLRNGSTGSDVKALQTALKNAGYGDYLGTAGVDGIYGSGTEAAVRAYQKDNGLTQDGIAGKNTLGSLYGNGNSAGNTLPTSGLSAMAQSAVNSAKQAAGATPSYTAPTTTPSTQNTGTGSGKTNNTTAQSTNTGSGNTNSGAGTPSADVPVATTPTTATEPFTYEDFSYAGWNAMDDPLIQQANALLQEHINSKPGEWVDPYKDIYMGYLSQYENRDPFSYDFNSDALYNQYKDQYIQQGKMAMMDTMGQAAALTGGYGNSYAQTVGQQAYNQQLNKLNEIMPELYQMAYERYGEEGKQLLDMYSAYLGLSEQDYNQHQNNLSNWYTQLDYLTDNYNTAYDRGYDEYLLGYDTAYNDYQSGRSEAFSAWQTQQDQEFTASENEKDRAYQSEENEKSRNFTAQQNELDRQTKQTTGTTTGGNTGGYEIPTLADSETMKKAVAKITSIAELKDQIAIWLSMGYDPELVNALTSAKAAELSGAGDDGVIDTTVDTTTTPTSTTDTTEDSEWEKEKNRRKWSSYGFTIS